MPKARLKKRIAKPVRKTTDDDSLPQESGKLNPKERILIDLSQNLRNANKAYNDDNDHPLLKDWIDWRAMWIKQSQSIPTDSLNQQFEEFRKLATTANDLFYAAYLNLSSDNSSNLQKATELTEGEVKSYRDKIIEIATKSYDENSKTFSDSKSDFNPTLRLNALISWVKNNDQRKLLAGILTLPPTDKDSLIRQLSTTKGKPDITKDSLENLRRELSVAREKLIAQEKMDKEQKDKLSEQTAHGGTRVPKDNPAPAATMAKPATTQSATSTTRPVRPVAAKVGNFTTEAPRPSTPTPDIYVPPKSTDATDAKQPLFSRNNITQRLITYFKENKAKTPEQISTEINSWHLKGYTKDNHDALAVYLITCLKLDTDMRTTMTDVKRKARLAEITQTEHIPLTLLPVTLAPPAMITVSYDVIDREAKRLSLLSATTGSNVRHNEIIDLHAIVSKPGFDKSKLHNDTIQLINDFENIPKEKHTPNANFVAAAQFEKTRPRNTTAAYNKKDTTDSSTPHDTPTAPPTTRAPLGGDTPATGIPNTTGGAAAGSRSGASSKQPMGGSGSGTGGAGATGGDDKKQESNPAPTIAKPSTLTEEAIAKLLEAIDSNLNNKKIEHLNAALKLLEVKLTDLDKGIQTQLRDAAAQAIGTSLQHNAERIRTSAEADLKKANPDIKEIGDRTFSATEIESAKEEGIKRFNEHANAIAIKLGTELSTKIEALTKTVGTVVPDNIEADINGLKKQEEIITALKKLTTTPIDTTLSEKITTIKTLADSKKAAEAEVKAKAAADAEEKRALSEKIATLTAEVEARVVEFNNAQKKVNNDEKIAALNDVILKLDELSPKLDGLPNTELKEKLIGLKDSSTLGIKQATAMKETEEKRIAERKAEEDARTAAETDKKRAEERAKIQLNERIKRYTSKFDDNEKKLGEIKKGGSLEEKLRNLSEVKATVQSTIDDLLKEPTLEALVDADKKPQTELIASLQSLKDNIESEIKSTATLKTEADARAAAVEALKAEETKRQTQAIAEVITFAKDTLTEFKTTLPGIDYKIQIETLALKSVETEITDSMKPDDIKLAAQTAITQPIKDELDETKPHIVTTLSTIIKLLNDLTPDPDKKIDDVIKRAKDEIQDASNKLITRLQTIANQAAKAKVDELKAATLGVTMKSNELKALEKFIENDNFLKKLNLAVKHDENNKKQDVLEKEIKALADFNTPDDIKALTETKSRITAIDVLFKEYKALSEAALNAENTPPDEAKKLTYVNTIIDRGPPTSVDLAKLVTAFNNAPAKIDRFIDTAAKKVVTDHFTPPIETQLKTRIESALDAKHTAAIAADFKLDSKQLEAFPASELTKLKTNINNAKAYLATIITNRNTLSAYAKLISPPNPQYTAIITLPDLTVIEATFKSNSAAIDAELKQRADLKLVNDAISKLYNAAGDPGSIIKIVADLQSGIAAGALSADYKTFDQLKADPSQLRIANDFKAVLDKLNKATTDFVAWKTEHDTVRALVAGLKPADQATLGAKLNDGPPPIAKAVDIENALSNAKNAFLTALTARATTAVDNLKKPSTILQRIENDLESDVIHKKATLKFSGEFKNTNIPTTLEIDTTKLTSPDNFKFAEENIAKAKLTFATWKNEYNNAKSFADLSKDATLLGELTNVPPKDTEIPAIEAQILAAEENIQITLEKKVTDVLDIKLDERKDAIEAVLGVGYNPALVFDSKSILEGLSKPSFDTHNTKYNDAIALLITHEKKIKEAQTYIATSSPPNTNKLNAILNAVAPPDATTFPNSLGDLRARLGTMNTAVENEKKNQAPTTALVTQLVSDNKTYQDEIKNLFGSISIADIKTFDIKPIIDSKDANKLSSIETLLANLTKQVTNDIPDAMSKINTSINVTSIKTDLTSKLNAINSATINEQILAIAALKNKVNAAGLNVPPVLTITQKLQSALDAEIKSIRDSHAIVKDNVKRSLKTNDAPSQALLNTLITTEIKQEQDKIATLEEKLTKQYKDVSHTAFTDLKTEVTNTFDTAQTNYLARKYLIWPFNDFADFKNKSKYKTIAPTKAMDDYFHRIYKAVENDFDKVKGAPFHEKLRSEPHLSSAKASAARLQTAISDLITAKSTADKSVLKQKWDAIKKPNVEVDEARGPWHEVMKSNAQPYTSIRNELTGVEVTLLTDNDWKAEMKIWDSTVSDKLKKYNDTEVKDAKTALDTEIKNHPYHPLQTNRRAAQTTYELALKNYNAINSLYEYKKQQYAEFKKHDAENRTYKQGLEEFKTLITERVLNTIAVAETLSDPSVNAYKLSYTLAGFPATIAIKSSEIDNYVSKDSAATSLTTIGLSAGHGRDMLSKNIKTGETLIQPGKLKDNTGRYTEGFAAQYDEKANRYVSTYFGEPQSLSIARLLEKAISSNLSVIPDFKVNGETGTDPNKDKEIRVKFFQEYIDSIQSKSPPELITKDNLSTFLETAQQRGQFTAGRLWTYSNASSFLTTYCNEMTTQKVDLTFYSSATLPRNEYFEWALMQANSFIDKTPGETIHIYNTNMNAKYTEALIMVLKSKSPSVNYIDHTGYGFEPTEKQMDAFNILMERRKFSESLIGSNIEQEAQSKKGDVAIDVKSSGSVSYYLKRIPIVRSLFSNNESITRSSDWAILNRDKVLGDQKRHQGEALVDRTKDLYLPSSGKKSDELAEKFSADVAKNLKKPGL